MLRACDDEEGAGMDHIDPVCGMRVDADAAPAAWEHDGKTYFFCSVGCWERFRDDPARFLDQAPGERSM